MDRFSILAHRQVKRPHVSVQAPNKSVLQDLRHWLAFSSEFTDQAATAGAQTSQCCRTSTSGWSSSTTRRRAAAPTRRRCATCCRCRLLPPSSLPAGRRPPLGPRLDFQCESNAGPEP